MNASYENFIKNGEIIYAGKPSSIVAHGGNNRMMLTLRFDAEPQITKVKVYWNFRADSATYNVQKLPGQNINLTFNSIAKGSYTFEVYTYDSAGHVSVKSEVTGQVYDAARIAELSSTIMPLKGANIIERSGVLDWYQTDYFAGLEITYTDITGTVKTTTVLGFDKIKAILPNVKPGSSYSYRVLFLPDVNALDTAYSAPVTGTFPIYSQLDKTKFQEYFIPPANIKLPGDYVIAPALGASGVSLELKKMWDDRYGDDDAYQSGTAALTALYFTIDLGVTTKLGNLRVYQRGINNSLLESTLLYNAGSPKTWELWGTANTPNPDGSNTGWTKLGDFTYPKPSNAAKGTNTVADEAAANAGHLIAIPTTAPAIRYLRWKTTANWGGVTNLGILEIALYEPAY
ncbi:DUF4998 domain-containing protein [Mucilaginibacter sp. AW1-3]